MPSAEAHDEDSGQAVSESAPAKAPGDRLKRVRVITAAVVLGGLTGLSAFILYAARQAGPALPRLTVERFDEERAKWGEVRLRDYDIEIEVKGPQPAVYAVQVRGGIAQQALRNGRPLTQRRTWGTWSVDGMFSTIAADVEHLRYVDDDIQAGSMQLTLGAEFDPEYHYPTRYFRLEQVQFGNNRSVTWEVLKFQPVERTQAPPEEDEAS